MRPVRAEGAAPPRAFRSVTPGRGRGAAPSGLRPFTPGIFQAIGSGRGLWSGGGQACARDPRPCACASGVRRLKRSTGAFHRGARTRPERGSPHPFRGIGAGARGEHHRLAAVDEGAVVDMGVDRAGEHLRLDVTAKAHVILGRLRMGDAHRVLLDDRALVEIGGDVMRRRANELHAALIGLLVGVRALEARQERVMDVDDPARHLGAQRIREDLHVARQHHELGAGLVDHGEQLGLGLGLVLLRHPDVVEGDVVVHHHLLIGQVVRDHADDLDRQRADARPVEQVVQAMAEVRHHQQHLHLARLIVQRPVHAEGLGDRGEARHERLAAGAGLRVDADAHEEGAALHVVVLVRVGDVASLLGQESRDRCDDAAGRLAGHRKHVGSHSRVLRWALAGVLGAISPAARPRASRDATRRARKAARVVSQTRRGFPIVERGGRARGACAGGRRRLPFGGRGARAAMECGCRRLCERLPVGEP
ncbi:hypothetical protein SDC9_30449 [bioreactor metagenome]|uniref:Uncharacterized protein n=1 Tax=bioreactor metagenome TaxID=1076179 RepID=A0A644UZW9_9ZZZZ